MRMWQKIGGMLVLVPIDSEDWVPHGQGTMNTDPTCHPFSSQRCSFGTEGKTWGRDGAIVHAIRKESKITKDKDVHSFFPQKKKTLKGGLLIFVQRREKH